MNNVEMDENSPSNVNRNINYSQSSRSKSSKSKSKSNHESRSSPSPSKQKIKQRKNRNSTFLHRLRLRKTSTSKDEKDKENSRTCTSTINQNSSNDIHNHGNDNGHSYQHQNQHGHKYQPSMIQKLPTTKHSSASVGPSSSMSISMPLSSSSPMKSKASSSPGKLKRLIRGSKRYKALENDHENENESVHGDHNATSHQKSTRNRDSASRRNSDASNALREIYSDALESKFMSTVEATAKASDSPDAVNKHTHEHEYANRKIHAASCASSVLKKRKSDEGSTDTNNNVDLGGGGGGSLDHDKRVRESHSPNSQRERELRRTSRSTLSSDSKMPTISSPTTMSASASASSVSMPPMETLELDPSSCEMMNTSLSTLASPVAMNQIQDSLENLYYCDESNEHEQMLYDQHMQVPVQYVQNGRRGSDESSFDHEEDLDHEEYPDNEGEEEDDMYDGDGDGDMDDFDLDDGGGDEDEDESESCASTVVNDLPPARLQKPPPGASKEEQDRFYWALCYGNNNNLHGKENTPPKDPARSWSANRRPPTKSCFSAKKTPWTEIAASATKRIQMKKLNQSKGTPLPIPVGHREGENGQTNPSPLDRVGANVAATPMNTGAYSTPQNFETESGKKSVKFGQSSAAEFESTRPTLELTPLPAELAREVFKVDDQDVQSDEESTEIHQETARNADTLAMWEDDFDTYCEDAKTIEENKNISIDDDEDDIALDPLTERKGSRRRQSSVSDRRGSRAGKRSGSRDNRRSSTFFSKEGGSLLDPQEFEEQSPDNHQTIEQTVKRREMHQGHRASVASRDSLQFSSPSTMGDSFLRLSSSSNESSKCTPTADVASSSNLLRSVHSAGGASTRQDDNSQDFKPSQLDFALQRGTNSPNGLEIAVEQGGMHQHDTLFALQNSAGTGELLQSLKIDFKKKHDVNTTFAIEEIDELKGDSMLDIIEELGETIRPIGKESSDTCRYDVSDILKMSISLVEELNCVQDQIDNENIAEIVEAMYTSCEEAEVEDIYAHFAEISNNQWRKEEGDALLTATNWLQPLTQSSCEEEAKISCLLKVVGGLSLETKTESSNRQYKHRINDELRAIEKLEMDIEEEQFKLQKLKFHNTLLMHRCECERLKPRDMLGFRLLKSLLPYDCHLQSPLSVIYTHLDNTQTVLTWKKSATPTKNDRRESLCSIDSLNTASLLDATTPKVKRQKKRGLLNPDKQYADGFLPERSVARKLYSLILDGDHTKRFITEQLKSERVMGILTLSDAFQRLNLLAFDVLGLQKYYTCRLDTSSKSKAVILHVQISLGQMCSIGVRFTFDCTQNLISILVPSEVFVEPITGEPAVPFNSLLTIAQRIIKTDSYANTFILQKTCTAIVDAIQGRKTLI